MDNIHIIFFPALVVLAMLSFLVRKRLMRLLLNREGKFCNHISLTSGALTKNSFFTSWNMAALVAFNMNIGYLSDPAVLSLLKKARIVDLSYYAIFIVYVYLVVGSFIE